MSWWCRAKGEQVQESLFGRSEARQASGTGEHQLDTSWFDGRRGRVQAGSDFLLFISFSVLKLNCCVDASPKGRQLVASKKKKVYVRVPWLAKWLGGLRWFFEGKAIATWGIKQGLFARVLSSSF